MKIASFFLFGLISLFGFPWPGDENFFSNPYGIDLKLKEPWRCIICGVASTSNQFL